MLGKYNFCLTYFISFYIICFHSFENLLKRQAVVVFVSVFIFVFYIFTKQKTEFNFFVRSERIK